MALLQASLKTPDFYFPHVTRAVPHYDCISQEAWQLEEPSGASRGCRLLFPTALRWPALEDYLRGDVFRSRTAAHLWFLGAETPTPEAFAAGKRLRVPEAPCGAATGDCGRTGVLARSRAIMVPEVWSLMRFVGSPGGPQAPEDVPFCGHPISGFAPRSPLCCP